MTKNAFSIALLVAAASITASGAASARHYVYVRDFNYSVNPKGQVEGRFSPTVARFPCKDGNFVNQFVVAN
jgi:hypothetical protein